nr:MULTISPECIES: recombinase family protein [unclassified Actinoplanes]
MGWAEDLDVSGDTAPWERPDLGRWLGDTPPAQFDIIAGMKIDRLSRNLLHLVRLIDWAAERGKYVAAYMDSVDTSDKTGELIAKVLALFAEFEGTTIAERSAQSREHLRRIGRWHGGTAPYGYRPVRNSNRAGGVFEHDPDTLIVFREIVERVKDGKSIRSVAQDLNARGVLSPRDHAADSLRSSRRPGGHGEAIHSRRGPYGRTPESR